LLSGGHECLDTIVGPPFAESKEPALHEPHRLWICFGHALIVVPRKQKKQGRSDGEKPVMKGIGFVGGTIYTALLAPARYAGSAEGGSISLKVSVL